MKAVSLILSVIVIMVMQQCTSDVAPLPCKTSADSHEISYSQEVFPIISTSCAVPTCHVANFPKGDFTTYNDLKARAEDGKLKFRLSGGQMPPASSNISPLNFCEHDIISRWIDQGAQNN